MERFAFRKCICAVLVLVASSKTFGQPIPNSLVESGTIRTAETYHLLVKSEAEAQRLSREIRSVPASQKFAKFKEVARRSSVDQSSASAGGSLGKVYEGVMVKDFEREVFHSKVGEVVGPYRSDFGWHLSYVVAFGTEPIVGLCRAPLLRALRSASGTEKAGLELASAPAEASTLPGKVLAILGKGWLGPFMDQYNNLTLFRVSDESGSGSIRLVTQHTELLDGQLIASTSPMGCVRSETTVWAVNCEKHKTAMYSYARREGRAAVGRALNRTDLGPSKAEFRPISQGSFGAQLYEMACAAVKAT